MKLLLTIRVCMSDILIFSVLHYKDLYAVCIVLIHSAVNSLSSDVSSQDIGSSLQYRFCSCSLDVRCL